MNGVVVPDLVQMGYECNGAHRWSQPAPLSEMTVFCDFDGPILDVSERYYHTYCLTLDAVQAHHQPAELPLHRLSKSQFWQMKQNRVPDPEIAMRSGLQPEQIDFFLRQVSQVVNQPCLLDQDCLQPGVVEALRLLQAYGVKLVLVTLRCQQQAIEILHSYGLLRCFAQVWGTSNEAAAYVNSAEHKTQLLSQAMSACTWTRSPAQSAWMVGDTEADVLAGQALGIPTIALACGIRSQSYLNRFAPTQMQADLLSAARFLAYSREAPCSI